MAAAQKVLKQMRDAGHEPDVVTWNSLVWGYAQQGDGVRARAMLDKARRLGCEPDAWAWSALLHGYARAGDMVAAEATLQEMRQLQAEQYARYCDALGAYQAAQAASIGGAPVGAGAGSSNGRSRTPRPGGPGSNSSSSSYHSRNGSSSNGRHAGPPRQPEPLVSAHAYGALVDGHMRTGDISAAEEAARRLQSEAGLPPSRIVYNTLLRGYCKLGMAGQERALQILGEMRAAGVPPGPDTYTTLLAAAAELPGVDGAVLQEQLGPGWGLDAAGNSSAQAKWQSTESSQGMGWPGQQGATTPSANGSANGNGNGTHPGGTAARQSPRASQLLPSQPAVTASQAASQPGLNGSSSRQGPVAPQRPQPGAVGAASAQRPQYPQQLSGPQLNDLRGPVRALSGAPPSVPPSMPAADAYVNGYAADGAAVSPLSSSAAAAGSPVNGAAANGAAAPNSAGPFHAQQRGATANGVAAAALQRGPVAAWGSGNGSSGVNGSSMDQGLPLSPSGTPLAPAGTQASVLLAALQADGLVADGALLTALMMLHAKAGRQDLALRTFEELRASPHARADAAAWSALAAVHVVRGAMGDAEEAAAQAVAVAQQQGQGPPEEAFGALVRGYASLNDLPRMLAAYKRFLVLGGRPSRRVLDVVVDRCLRRGEFTRALKVLRAAELTGAQVTRERYQGWFKRWEGWHERRGSSTGSGSDHDSDHEAAAAASRGRGGGLGEDGQMMGFERFKWWLGLPNNYYEPDWRAGSNGGSSQGSSRHRDSSGSSRNAQDSGRNHQHGDSGYHRDGEGDSGRHGGSAQQHGRRSG